MATEYLKKFYHGDAILAEDTNWNNEFLLGEISNKAKELQQYLKNEVERLQGSFVPVGTIMGFPFENIPEGFIACDGSRPLISDYPILAELLGEIYGEKDELRFTLPDFTGVFFRGVGGNAGSLGVKQTSAVPNITGTIGGISTYSGTTRSGVFKNAKHIHSANGGTGVTFNNVSFSANAWKEDSVYKNDIEEVRPDNYSLVWAIKAD